MIGTQKKEITQKRELMEEIRTAKIDKIKVFEHLTPMDEAAKYIRQNQQYQHTLIVVSSR